MEGAEIEEDWGDENAQQGVERWHGQVGPDERKMKKEYGDLAIYIIHMYVLIWGYSIKVFKRANMYIYVLIGIKGEI